MRYLNKIIFINSANVPYSEVLLDGNVHFGGTQGVGKSTVLRAILFFYTADQKHLGIQLRQKSFEEFYFPKINSYIIYEVKALHGFYTILLRRSGGKIEFRFIDAPYRMEWFIGENRRAEHDWTRIRSNIGNNIDISAKVDTFEQYRNIIFGNIRDSRHSFDKYAIVESTRYQNIPRSIQNVFLNSKLDADFVKNTIINSMTDDEDFIDLSAYRPQMEDFDREFVEVSCWFSKDSKGNIPVRMKADKVIDIYRLIMALKQEMLQTWHRMNYAVGHSRNQIPLVEDKIVVLEDGIIRLDEKLENCRKDYNKEHDSLREKIGEVNSILKQIRLKRKEYDDINIRDILARDAECPRLMNERSRKTQLLNSLEAKFSDIAEKYRRVRQSLEDGWNSFVQVQKAELQQLRDEQQSQRDRMAGLSDKRKADIDRVYSEWLAESDGRMDSLRAEYNRTDKRLSELKFWHPKQTEIDNVKEEILELGVEQSKLQSELSAVHNDLKVIRQEYRMLEEQLTNDHASRTKALQGRIEAMDAEISGIEDILARWDGSLYQWLNNNRPGWEDNIGKVVDEQRVLYAGGLSPVLTEGDGLFGVRIDLEAIESNHRSPDDYRRILEEKGVERESLVREADSLEKELQERLATLKKTFTKRINEKQQQETTINFNLEQIPRKQDSVRTKLRMLSQEEDDLIAREKESRTDQHNKSTLALDKESKERFQRKEQRDKEFKRVETEYKSALRNAGKQLDALRKRLAEDSAARRKETDLALADANRMESEELKGKGADTEAIRNCRLEIKTIDEKLALIEKQRHYIYEYRKDEKELFSREPEYKDRKQELEARDESVSKNYEDRRLKLLNEKSENANALGAETKRLESLKDGLRQYELLLTVENIVPDELRQDEREEKNKVPCSDFVAEMRGAINRSSMARDDLKRAVNAFNTHFGVNNTFRFIIPQFDEDYMDFAVNLLEFVDNNKIEVYRMRMSEHYSNILTSISREIGMLMNHTSDIRKIINDVNNDFRERNFAGVIRSIELKIDESSDQMMQLLRTINEFVAEKDLSLGAVNLFSEGDTDRVNLKAVEYLRRFMRQLQKDNARTRLTLSDTFTLKFRVVENDNDTGWQEKISNVGSDGTDILVKAMVNIMLINVFKQKAARKNGDFIIHCMMDEIGKLHPNNVDGILRFANVRNIYLINSSPMSYNADSYRYNYLLEKDSKSQTHIKLLLKNNV